jgi:alpha-galactosidase
MVLSGMQCAGYEYIVIDDCWQVGRDKNGNIVVDSLKFPSGMKALADYIHSKGLKFGIYSDAGRKTCAGRPGSRGYEYQDARTYASWGVDYLKYDWCYAEEQSAKADYALMRDALHKADRPVLFSMCEWGANKPWNWAKDVAHLWRTTGDIRNNWDAPYTDKGVAWGGGVTVNLDLQVGLEEYAGPGGWNDPDMLFVGNNVLTEEEDRAHFSLWCMLAAPLIAGNDLRNMSETTQKILTNSEVIAVDQDPLGKQGYRIRDWGEFEIYYKPLQSGDIAICLFNRYDHAIKIELDWSTLDARIFANGKELEIHQQLKSKKNFMIEGNYKVRDLWEKQFIGNNKQVLKAEISKHDVVALRLVK